MAAHVKTRTADMKFILGFGVKASVRGMGRALLKAPPFDCRLDAPVARWSIIALHASVPQFRFVVADSRARGLLYTLWLILSSPARIAR